MNAAASRQRRAKPAVWVPRAAALVALVATAIALIVAVAGAGGGSSGSSSERSLLQALARISARNQELSRQLAALAPGTSPRGAQDAARQTIALVRRLQGEFPAGGDVGSRAQAVFAPELDYLDAVGSVLANPRSPLRDQVVSRAQDLRGALESSPASSPDDVKGYVHLVNYSRARLQG